MELAYGVIGVTVSFCVIAAIGYKVARHLDKRYGTARK